jgi:hypothetical protein
MSPRSPKEIKLDSLAARLNLFEVIQSIREVFASSTDTPETEDLHREVAELIGQLRDKERLAGKSDHDRTR